MGRWVTGDEAGAEIEGAWAEIEESHIFNCEAPMPALCVFGLSVLSSSCVCPVVFYVGNQTARQTVRQS